MESGRVRRVAGGAACRCIATCAGCGSLEDGEEGDDGKDGEVR